MVHHQERGGRVRNTFGNWQLPQQRDAGTARCLKGPWLFRHTRVSQQGLAATHRRCGIVRLVLAVARRRLLRLFRGGSLPGEPDPGLGNVHPVSCSVKLPLPIPSGLQDQVGLVSRTCQEPYNVSSLSLEAHVTHIGFC